MAERERASGSLVLELAPEDYSYEMLSQAMAAESAGSWAKLGAYAVAWKYLIYVLVMKALVKDASGRLKRDAEPIAKYLRDKHGVSSGALDTLIGYLKRVEGFKIGDKELSIKRTAELHHLYKLEELHELLGPLDSLLSTRKVIVLVDELDRGWNASEDARAYVAGLFQACVAMNTRHQNLRVYMSLRQELYGSIPELYDDAQKFRDLIERIEWDEQALLQLAANRIRHSLPQFKNLTDRDAWQEIFSPTLEYRKSDSFNYVVDRTLYRPREIIQMCSSTIEEAERQKSEPPLTYATISSAEVTYSNDRITDIAAKYRFQYPGLTEVFNVFRGRIYNFEREELELLCLELAVGEHALGAAEPWVRGADPEQIIRVLWSIGFLSARVVGGVKGRFRTGSEYLGPHQVENLNLPSVARFRVHAMFRAGLGMKEK